MLYLIKKGGNSMLAHQGSFTLILVLFILLVIICGIC
ncbi:MAG: YjcZ family sporulation protein [Coprobacillus cateniformis]|nr:YjcZ family sporulation protein [Coprobacillus cateniformis]MVX29242.1 YjcZ family sporulation protein [Coprobacillus cateniformis]RGO09904.1 YjcZ family sporulation protein [Coprobacillus cateniformis]RGO19087.1 YjcZ family sporulation protein [Coprobacillus cateniformis]RGY47954.1 YjcZ family sporulation protein [Coprobacillus cateniformis]